MTDYRNPKDRCPFLWDSWMCAAEAGPYGGRCVPVNDEHIKCPYFSAEDIKAVEFVLANKGYSLSVTQDEIEGE